MKEYRQNFLSGDTQRDQGLTTPEDILRMDNISYGGSDVLVTDIYCQKAAASLNPTIVSVHGGTWVAGSKGTYQYYCMSLVQRLYAALAQKLDLDAWYPRGEDGKLRIRPRIPKRWTRLSYTLLWKGQKLKITVTKTQLTVENLTRTAPVALELNGTQYTLSDQAVTVPGRLCASANSGIGTPKKSEGSLPSDFSFTPWRGLFC